MFIGHLSWEMSRWTGFETARSIVSRVAACVIADRDRWVLWTPVGLGVGIGLYFGLPTEPPFLVGPAILVAVLALGLPPVTARSEDTDPFFAFLHVAAELFPFVKARNVRRLLKLRQDEHQVAKGITVEPAHYREVPLERLASSLRQCLV